MGNFGNDKLARLLWPFLLLMAAAYGLYSGTFAAEWTTDDLSVLVENPDIRSLSGFVADSYPGRPLREITYLADYFFFGLNPAGYHIQNIFWHGLNAFLVFCLIGRLQRSTLVSLAGALLFLAHPIQVEVVANISHRKDSLALAFILLSLLAYANMLAAQSTRRIFFAAASLLCVYLACLAKQPGVLAVGAFVLYELTAVSPERRFLTRYWKTGLAFCLVGAVGLASYFFWNDGIQAHREAIIPVLNKVNVQDWTEGSYFLYVIKSWGFMLAKYVVPVGLAVEYVYPAPRTFLDPWVLGTVAAVIVYVAALVASWKRSPCLFFFLGWMGIFWLPVSNIWPFSYFAADRYMYIPSVGFCAVASYLLYRLLAFVGEGRSRYAYGILVAVIVSSLGFATWKQSQYWLTSFALWTRAVEVSPMSTFALEALADCYEKRGDNQTALAIYKRAFLANPNSYRNRFRLAQMYMKMGDVKAAQAIMKR